MLCINAVIPFLSIETVQEPQEHITRHLFKPKYKMLISFSEEQQMLLRCSDSVFPI